MPPRHFGAKNGEQDKTIPFPALKNVPLDKRRRVSPSGVIYTF